MKKIFALAIIVALTGCGYSNRDVEVVGQVKRVVHNTPLICPDYDDIDLSLGVMRNGTGSMSTQDIYLNVMNKADLATLKEANSTGVLVKLTYDTKRVRICTTSGREITKVELVK